MQGSKKFAFDVGITFFASAISMPLGFVITILLGRYLGAEDLGLYRMTSTIYGIIILFAAIGIPAAMIKYVAESKDNKCKLNQIASSGIITSLFLGIGFVALCYFLSDEFAEIFNMPGVSGLLKILSPVFPFALVNGALLGLLNGLREMKLHATGLIVQSVLMIISAITLIYLGFGVVGVVISNVLSSIGSCIFLVWVCRKYFKITFERYTQTTKKMLHFGSQIFGANAINTINYQADVVMIGYFLTAADVGYYTVAVGFSRFFWIIPRAIQKITYPATSEYWNKNNYTALQKMIDKSLKYTACALLPIGLGVGFFTREVVTVLFGDDFAYSFLPLQILVVGAVIYGVNIAIGGSITGVGRPDIGLKVVCLTAITNILLNFLLIPYLGIVGAALATATSLSLSALVGLFLTTKIVKVNIDFKWFTKISGITFLAVLSFTWFEFINVYVFGILILCIYLLVILMFLLTDDDRMYFMGLFREVCSFKDYIIKHHRR